MRCAHNRIWIHSCMLPHWIVKSKSVNTNNQIAPWECFGIFSGPGHCWQDGTKAIMPIYKIDSVRDVSHRRENVSGLQSDRILCYSTTLSRASQWQWSKNQTSGIICPCLQKSHAPSHIHPLRQGILAMDLFWGFPDRRVIPAIFHGGLVNCEDRHKHRWHQVPQAEHVVSQVLLFFASRGGDIFRKLPWKLLKIPQTELQH